jgi:hypothetical protein
MKKPVEQLFVLLLKIIHKKKIVFISTSIARYQTKPNETTPSFRLNLKFCCTRGMDEYRHRHEQLTRSFELQKYNLLTRPRQLQYS